MKRHLGLLLVVAGVGCGDNPAKNRCQTAADCADGQSCLNGECVQPCNRDADCQPVEACTDGVCRRVSVPACSAHADCVTPGLCEHAAGARCEAGACLYLPRVVDSACDDGNACTDGEKCDARRVCGGGAVRVCHTPPPSECLALDTVFRTYSSPGTCDPVTGGCTYPSTDTPCTGCLSNCLTCDSHADCAPTGYCNTDQQCAARVGDGGSCATIGHEACVSRYCDGSLCCSHGDCCNNPGDCPATYAGASVCGDTTPATDCQGVRLERACEAHVCASQAVDDDRGCVGLLYACPNHLAPVACADAESQPPPACASGCAELADCADGYRCDAPTCVLPAGTGASCSGTGQGSCEGGLKCENGVCCAAVGPSCCADAGDCTGGLACNSVTAACYVTCNDYDSSRCAQGDTYCFDDVCLAKNAAGSACLAGGQCLTGHCQNGFCCTSGDCCALPGDCPTSYAAPSACTVTGAATTCQGTRRYATCTSNSCGTVSVDDDRGCSGEVRTCPDNLAPVACTNQAEQPQAACLSACVDSEDCDAGFVCVAPDCVAPLVVVEPAYPAHPAWNDYIVNGDPGAGPYGQADVGCLGTEVGREACLHSGELRRVVVPTATSCAGLTMTDTLGAFLWRCDDSGPLTFTSAGFALGRGLAHLVDASGFLPNAVSVLQGGNEIAHSDPAVWWSNPVMPLPPNGGASRVVLDTPGVVYVAAVSADTAGYNLNADRIAVVTRPGVTLSWGGGTTSNCRWQTGETASANDLCLFAAGTQRFLWLETSIDDPSGAVVYLVLWHAVTRSRLHRLAAHRYNSPYREAVELNGGSSGNLLTDLAIDGSELALLDADYNRIERVRVTNPGGSGFDVELSDFNSFAWLEASGGVGSGLLLKGARGNAFRHVYLANFGRGVQAVRDATDTVLSQYNVFVDLTVANLQIFDEWDGEALRLYNETRDNTVVGLLAVGSEQRGLYDADDANQNTFSHVTSANHGGSGITLGAPAALTIVQTVSVNNHDNGLTSFWQFSTGCRVNNFYASLNRQSGLSLYDVQDFRFTGHLWVGLNGSPQCYLGGTNTNPGLVHSTCSQAGTEGSHIFDADPTSAILHIDRNLTNSFVGKLTTNEPVNQSDTNGARSYANIIDWLGFANRFRAWGGDGLAFPDASNRTPCLSGETCRVWDWRVRASDTALRNVNGPFVDGASCPAAVDGTTGVLEDQVQVPWRAELNAVENVGNGGDEDGVCEAGETCHNRFLVAAVEVLEDARGDDDGLCESGEACIYSPNVGAYQGEGDFTTRTCTFAPGTITGVTMYAYPVNGG